MRTDIPPADQIVQVGHACLEAGRRFAQPDEPCHLVVLAVRGQEALLDAAGRLEAVGIRVAVFWEPDEALGYTALATEPVCGLRQWPLRRYPLWRPR